MTDEPNSPTLRILSRMDEKLDRVLGDMDDLKHQVTSLEQDA
jgi:hypothetical protein